jgi:hypothetical protein
MGPTTPELLLHRGWQMSPGERAAIEGLVSHLKPVVSIELGAHLGGSLRRIAAHSGSVHSFDLALQVDEAEFPNVTFHIGDSHVLLSRVLQDIADEGQRVGFALVDGDHSPTGARQDLTDLLDSSALGSGMIVMHDTGNEAVRRGLESVPYQRYSNIAFVDLDFVPSMPAKSRLQQSWGGLGLIVLDDDRTGIGAVPQALMRARDTWAIAREVNRRTRRVAGIGLRKVGMHPAQRKRSRS